MSQATSDNITTEQPQSPAEALHHGLFEIEVPTSRLHGLAYAIRMLASSDEMPKESGAALDTVADTLVNEVNLLIAEHARLFRLSHEARAAKASLQKRIARAA